MNVVELTPQDGHGTRYSYTMLGCRCVHCQEANRQYAAGTLPSYPVTAPTYLLLDFPVDLITRRGEWADR